MINAEFPFKFITKHLIRKKNMNLDGSKAILNGDTSVNILKSTVDIHPPYIRNILDLSIEGYIPHELKLA